MRRLLRRGPNFISD